MYLRQDHRSLLSSPGQRLFFRPDAGQCRLVICIKILTVM
jgi:hypothetical protein